MQNSIGYKKTQNNLCCLDVVPKYINGANLSKYIQRIQDYTGVTNIAMQQP